jgi:glutaredoxin
MKIILYGLPTCSRCTTAKMMLDQRVQKGIIQSFEYRQVSPNFDHELPKLLIDNKPFYGKEALLEIRNLVWKLPKGL